MAKFEIIVGSMLGATEYVADSILESIEQAGHTGQIHLHPQLSQIDLSAPWVICTSTHGAGDLPDNIEPFAKELATTDLATVKFIVIGLGDSSYDTFCHGAQKMQQLCQRQGAELLAPPLWVDVLEHPIPEEEAQKWFASWLQSRY